MGMAPAVVPVNVAVYVPSLWSTRLLKVPRPVPPPSPKLKDKPPLPDGLPAVSRAVSVTVAVLPDGMLAGVTAILDWNGSAPAGLYSSELARKELPVDPPVISTAPVPSSVAV